MTLGRRSSGSIGTRHWVVRRLLVLRWIPRVLRVRCSGRVREGLWRLWRALSLEIVHWLGVLLGLLWLLLRLLLHRHRHGHLRLHLTGVMVSLLAAILILTWMVCLL